MCDWWCGGGVGREIVWGVVRFDIPWVFLSLRGDQLETFALRRLTRVFLFRIAPFFLFVIGSWFRGSGEAKQFRN